MKSDITAVYLVSCVKSKCEQACRAQELYVSDWFLKARHYAEASGCRWFILSAKYGLVPPDRVIAPYEQTLNKMPIAERQAWAARVTEQFALAVPKLSHVVFFAGERYREFLVPNLKSAGIQVDVPMEGLAFGKQLSWLQQHSPRSSA